jgi:predicted HNH restriction endonuclease
MYKFLEKKRYWIVSKKKIDTPRYKIRAALRLLWLRSRERASILKLYGYRCKECNIKQSKAKGKEVKIEVHHEPEINWDGLIDLIIERLLKVPQFPLCKECHKKKHIKK